DRSLLYRAAGRYRALETIREYGLAALDVSGRSAEAAHAQRNVLGGLAIAWDARLRGPGIYEALDWFDAEDDNIVAALEAGSVTGDADGLVRLAAGCAWYWVIRDRSEDALHWLSVAEPLAEGLDSDEAVIIRVFAAMVRALGEF